MSGFMNGSRKKIFVPSDHLFFAALLIGFLFLTACNRPAQQSTDLYAEVDRKVDSLLEMMTLEEKIGQMTQVRHFDLTSDDEVADKYIGSIIHTDGPTPGKDAAS